MTSKKWHEVYERLPIERKDKSLMEISGFGGFCTDMASFRQKVLNYLSAQFNSSQQSNICEVGCGCGDKLSFFYNLGHHCHGVDFSSTMIERATQEMPNADLHTSEAARLPFADNSMDFIFSYSVIFYFDSWDYCQKVFSEMYRIAKPGAVICICDIPDIREKEKVAAFRGDPEPGYEHTYYDMNDIIQWFKSREIAGIKSEYLFMPEYKHSYHRFHITVKLDKKSKE